MNLRSFGLYSDYSCPLTLSNVGEPLWNWISRDHIQAQKEKENFIVACLRTSSIKREIRHFHVVVVQNGKEMYKKVWCTCEVVVFLIKPIVLWRSRCTSTLLELKVPIPRLRSPHGRESKILLVFGFHAMDSEFQVLNSRSLPVELGFRSANSSF